MPTVALAGDAIQATTDGKSGTSTPQVQVIVPVDNRAVVVEVAPAADAAPAKPAPVRVLVQGAAGQAVVVRQYGAANGNNLEWDPADARIRFLVLAAAGPMLWELQTTIDGQPFAQAREKLFAAALARGDTNGDGQIGWEEALSNPRFSMGRIGAYGQGLSSAQTEAQRKVLQNFVKQFDANSNGLVEAEEARRFFSQVWSSTSLSVLPSYGNYGQAAGQSLREKLDANRDGRLSRDEFQAVPERLKSFDSDGNDLLTQAEINGNANPYGVYVAQRGGAAATSSNYLVLLTSKIEWPRLREQLAKRYGDTKGQGTADLSVARFQGWSAWLARLDADESGLLDDSELEALLSAEPQVQLAVDFSNQGNSQASVKLLRLAPELANSANTPAAKAPQLTLALAGLKMEFQAHAMASMGTSLENQAKQIVSQLDRDKNGYLDMEDLKEQRNAYAYQFKAWDANADEKVYAEEVLDYLQTQFAPQLAQVSLSISQPPDPYWAALDTSGDQRLGAREMAQAGARLAALDANEDGQIDAQEIPEQLSLVAGQGNAGYSAAAGRLAVVQATGGGMVRNAPPANSANAPEWFLRMDRNGDGDVTRQEFLGGDDKFAQLDSNSDGFIEPREAKAAESPSAAPMKPTNAAPASEPAAPELPANPDRSK